ncbi:MAG: hypothetical protein QNJ90_06375 [Planctomycetota bacterium]|nr:hypothetical protein [Planctomycetota bacterium]
MIHVVLTRRHAYTIGQFLESGGEPLRGHIRTLPFDELFGRRALPGGTYVLSDFERLTPARLQHVTGVADALEASPVARLLNHPQRWVGRYDLLRQLHAAGRNPFAAYRLAELPGDVRYPVFLRVENDHQGARTGMLSSRDEIEEAAAKLERRGKSRKALIVVEFQDTVDEKGQYRKYGAFCVAGRIVPRHLFFGHRWSVKGPANCKDEQFDEEEAWMRDNPHEAELQEIFSLAGVDYGRIDYALVDGRICVWEINTNPMIAIPEDATTGRPGALNALFHERFREALHAIDMQSTEEITLPPMRVGLGERLAEARERLSNRLRRR